HGAIRRHQSRGLLPPTSLLLDRSFILVDSHPAFYFLFEISYLLKENVPVREKHSDLKNPISAFAVA
ncbi:hypothetical protein, partial [[Ruminococcus] lactaris]|uniref:hypothetical protein n=1 Tax=[Ruminococcus] lactaris TaxID=46228 RepID=UPI00307B03EA